MKPIWERLRAIADQAEHASQQALSEEAVRRLQEYRKAHIADPVEVSEAAYQEIAAKLHAAGYEHAFVETENDGEDVIAIDMHGIALVLEPDEPVAA